MMTGYCEACKAERPSAVDEYGVECCGDCGNDMLIDMHVQQDETEEDFGDWINQS